MRGRSLHKRAVHQCSMSGRNLITHAARCQTLHAQHGWPQPTERAEHGAACQAAAYRTCRTVCMQAREAAAYQTCRMNDLTMRTQQTGKLVRQTMPGGMSHLHVLAMHVYSRASRREPTAPSLRIHETRDQSPGDIRYCNVHVMCTLCTSSDGALYTY